MAVYPGSEIGGSIGALLRKIQEERERMPHMVAPGAEAGAPMREMVTEPLKQVEAPETARVVSIRPELGPAAAGAGPQVVPPVAPVAPIAGMPSIVPPSMSGGAPSPGGAPSAPSFAPSPAPRGAGVSAKLGMPRAGVMGMGARAKTPSFIQPTGTLSAAPARSTYGGQPILRTAAQAAPSLLRSLATRILPTIAKGVTPALAAFGMAARQLKKSPWLLKPGGLYAKKT